MSDHPLTGDDPFAGIDPRMQPPSAPALEGDDPFKEFQPVAPVRTTGLGAATSHAARGLLPLAGGMAAAGTGAELGAAAGGLAGPVGAVAGGFVGGVAGFFGGSYLAEGAQDYAIHQMPDGWQDAIGQSDRYQRLQEQQHPYYSFLGGAAPYLLTMSPGALTTKALNLPADATAFQRIIANPVTNRLFSGAAMGGMELGQEAWDGQTPDWAKIGISTGLGLIFNKPTKFGEYLTGLGAAPFRAFRSPIDIPPEGVLKPAQPTVSQARDVNVVGPGITEATHQGQAERSEAAATSAHNVASEEQAALGALPTPDYDTIARRMEPDLFNNNDELLARRDSLRDFIAGESNPTPEMFDDLSARQNATEEALRNANPRSPDARRYRAELADIEDQRQELLRRQEAFGTDGYIEPTEVSLARQHLADTNRELLDLGPSVAAARRRAEETGGPVEEANRPPPQTHPTTTPGESTALPVEAAQGAAQSDPSAQKSIHEQRSDIITDRTAQLVAAGMSQEQATINATVEAHYYLTLAQRFEGHLGSAWDLYRERSPSYVRPGQTPVAAPAVPTTAVAAPVVAPAESAVPTVPNLSEPERLAREAQTPGSKPVFHKDADLRTKFKIPKGAKGDALITAIQAAEVDLHNAWAAEYREVSRTNIEPTPTPIPAPSEAVSGRLPRSIRTIMATDGVRRAVAQVIMDRERLAYADSLGTRVGGPAPQKPANEGLFERSEEDQDSLFQRAKRAIQGRVRVLPGEVRSIITRLQHDDSSTFMHETAHDWLKQLMQDSLHPFASDQLKADAGTVRRWLNRPDGWTGFKPNGDPDSFPHERFARTFEQYLREGVAPTPSLAKVFHQFRQWLTTIYDAFKNVPGSRINEDIRQVFDRMLDKEPERTTYVPEREAPPLLATIHETDAAETEPQHAEAVGDRVVSERDRSVAEQHPEITSELVSATARTGTVEPGTETGSGPTGRAEVALSGGQPEPVTTGGGGSTERSPVQQGGGAPIPEGARPSTRTVPAGEQRRPVSGSTPGPEQLAPKPAQSFSPEADPKLVDLAGNIRVENLTDIESIAQAIHDSSNRNEEFRAIRGGMTKGQMLDLADSMGLDPAKIDEATLARMFGGTQELGAKILAARRLVVQSAGIVSDAMKIATESGSDHDLGALAVAIARHDMIQSALAGVTAEWGRAGNAFHSLLAGWESAQDINQILKDNTGRDLFQLKMIAKMGARLDTPGKVSKYLRDAKERSFGRMILEYWINGLISGISTHVTYMVGGSLLAAEKAGPETAAAWAIGKLRAATGRTGERVHLGEVGAQFGAAFRELPTAVQATLEAYRSGATTLLPGESARPLIPFVGDTSLTVSRNMTNTPVTWSDVKGDAYSLIQGMRDGITAGADLVSSGGVPGAPLLGWQYSPLGQIPDIAYRGVNVLPIGTLARLPSRNVAAIHSFQRSMNYSMEINALAFRQASEEGLSGTPFATRIADLRQNPTNSMMEQARTKSTDLTLMGPGGKWIERLASLVNTPFNLPLLGETPVFKFIDPFVHIAANIMNQGLMQRTPVGLFSREIRADLAGMNGNVAADTAAAKMLAGSAIAITFGGLAAQGLASGSGPSDPNKAAMWRLAGNQAHSVRVGDTWYAVNRLGPMGMLLSVSADMYDVAHQIGREDADVVGKSLIHAFTQNILDESFMRGPADLIKAVTEPDHYGSGYVRTQLASFLPYSVLMAQMARATDPYSRQARTIMDVIRARTPGQSESLFPRRDIWGASMPSGDALVSPGVTAIYARQMSTDPVNLAMLNLGVSPAPVGRTIRNVPLTDQQYDDFARVAGVGAKMRLDTIVRSPDFQSWPAFTRHEVIEEVVRQSREAARGWVMMKYPQIPRDAALAQINRATGASR